MIRRLYDWAMGLAQHRNAYWAVGTVSFLDSSVLPLPPDVIMIPMMIADRTRIWRIAAVCTITSVLGAALGYAIGLFLFESIGRAILDLYGYMDDFAAFQASYNEWGWWIVMGGGLTPFPFKIVTIASGVTKMDFAVFMLASAISRASRFYAEAALLWWFGPAIRTFVERRLALVTTVTFLLVVGGFVAARYLF